MEISLSRSLKIWLLPVMQCLFFFFSFKMPTLGNILEMFFKNDISMLYCNHDRECYIEGCIECFLLTFWDSSISLSTYESYVSFTSFSKLDVASFSLESFLQVCIKRFIFYLSALTIIKRKKKLFFEYLRIFVVGR